MLEQLLLLFLELSAALRPTYKDSLGNVDRAKTDDFYRKYPNAPEILKMIYSQVQGTRHGIQDQKLMDFIPGYRLIHIDEYDANWDKSRKIVKQLGGKDAFFPILANYSSDFIGVYDEGKGDVERICSIEHDGDEIILMHKDPESFLATICEFYKQDVYFLDDDGYLDYDSDKEGKVGAALNPGVDYWLR